MRLNKPFGNDCKLVQSLNVWRNIYAAGAPSIPANSSDGIDCRLVQPAKVLLNMLVGMLSIELFIGETDDMLPNKSPGIDCKAVQFSNVAVNIPWVKFVIPRNNPDGMLVIPVP